MNTIYNYDRLTGAFLSENEARVDPRNDERLLIPAHATEIAPPENVSEGMFPSFTDGEWVELPIPIAPVEPEEEVDPLVQLTVVREAALKDMVCVTANGDNMQCRPKDKQAIEDAIDIMTRGQLTTYTWFSVENQPITVTSVDLENAIISGQDQGAVIWSDFFQSVAGLA